MAADIFTFQIIEEVGVDNVSAVVSDNTGNTRKAREILCKMIPHILNMQDCCHEINLAIMQICQLPIFEPVSVLVMLGGGRIIDTVLQLIEDIKAILSYMKSSTYTLEQFNDVHIELKIMRGLESIGKTRFSSYTWTGESVRRCVPAFRAIIKNIALGIDIQVRLVVHAQVLLLTVQSLNRDEIHSSKRTRQKHLPSSSI